MNFRWARSTKLSVILLAITVVAVGALTALVMRQQHDLRAHPGQVRLGTAPVAPGASVPAQADMVINPRATVPAPASAPPAPASAPVAPASQPAPVSPAPQADPAPQVAPAPPVVPARPAAPAPELGTTHITPALVAPAPHAVAPRRVSPPRQKPVTPQRPPVRQVTPVPPPRQPAPAQPVAPGRPAKPDTPAKPDSPAKPGPPEVSWSTDNDNGSDSARTVTVPSDSGTPDSGTPPRNMKPTHPNMKPTHPQVSTKSTRTAKNAEKSPSGSAPTRSTGVRSDASPMQAEDVPAPCPPKAAVSNPPITVGNKGASKATGEQAAGSAGDQQDTGESRERAGNRSPIITSASNPG